MLFINPSVRPSSAESRLQILCCKNKAFEGDLAPARTVVPQEGIDSGHFQIILNRGARRLDILIGGVGNMQFYPINEKTLEL